METLEDGYTPQPWVNCFWTKQGEEALLTHVASSSATLNDLRTVFKELASLEKDYSKQLRKISSLTIGKEETGLASTLLEFKQSLLARAEMHEKLSADVSGNLEAKMKDHEAGRETRKRKHQAAVTSLHKSKIKLDQELNDRKERYKSDALAIRSYNTQLNLLKRKDLNKVKTDLEKAKKSIKKTEVDYKSACKQMKETCRNFEFEWKGFCDLAEDLEEDRIHCIRETLVLYSQMYEDVSEAGVEPVKRLRTAIDSWDTLDAIATFVRQKSGGNTMPVAPEFINFAEGEEEPSQAKTRTACFSRSSFRYPGTQSLRPSDSSTSLNQANTSGYESPSPAPSPSKVEQEPKMTETPPFHRVSRIKSEAQASPSPKSTPLQEKGTMLSIGNHLFPVEVSPESRNDSPPRSSRSRAGSPEKEEMRGEQDVLRALENMNVRKRGNLPTPPPSRRQGSDPTISPSTLRRPQGWTEHHANSFPRRTASGDRGTPSGGHEIKPWSEKRTASPAALAYKPPAKDTLFDPVLSPTQRSVSPNPNRSASPNPAFAPTHQRAVSPNPAYTRTPSPYAPEPYQQQPQQRHQQHHLSLPGEAPIQRSPSPSHNRHGSLPLSPSVPTLSTFARQPETLEPPSVNNASRPTFNRQRSQSVQNLDQYYHRQPTPVSRGHTPISRGATPLSPAFAPTSPQWQSPHQSFSQPYSPAQSPAHGMYAASASQPSLVQSHRVQQPVLFCVRAAHPYAAARPDELTLHAGDEIAVIEQGADGWWTGELKGHGIIGKFPSTFVN